MVTAHFAHALSHKTLSKSKLLSCLVVMWPLVSNSCPEPSCLPNPPVLFPSPVCTLLAHRCSAASSGRYCLW
ncbi:hypothetical protein C8Q69DRAFT_457503 [Paecilomyces variotii]|uniref:Uncharacterized protein n=1 Tax=Byssochlamys spectabilis TaxID=264951 RepID=A0A443I1V4_BYSSP|nr:hypothetical protein C8Q69DRAFT_457503 [Paecilomyces variotii]RWQ98017.1 hypothetical protein C8Q69DRAFT_457503 [Paecilomyces variotii]